MYRKIVIPTDTEHNIELPESLYGKQVEITVKGIVVKSAKPVKVKKLPAGLKNKAFWEDITYDPNFSSIEEIRQTAWPEKTFSFYPWYQIIITKF